MEVHIAVQIKHTSSDICSASNAIGISAHTDRSVEFLSGETRASNSDVKKSSENAKAEEAHPAFITGLRRKQRNSKPFSTLPDDQ